MIDFEKINKSQIFFDKNISRPFYSTLKSISLINSVRFLAPVVGTCDFLISSAVTTATLSETFFKGSANILGSIFNDNFNAKKGLFQIGGGLFIASLSLPNNVARTVNVTLSFFHNPHTCTSHELERIAALIDTPEFA